MAWRKGFRTPGDLASKAVVAWCVTPSQRVVSIRGKWTMNRFLRVTALIAFGFSGLAFAAPQSDSLPSPGVSDNSQLERMLVDYRLAAIMRTYFNNNQAALQGSPVGAVFEHLNEVQDAELAHVMAPALRDCVTEDEAKGVADFLETDTGRTVINYMLTNMADPQHSVPQPQVDARAMQRFQANGGAAALQKFSACLKSPDGQRRATIALVHYLTRPELNPGT
jgi:hypothetical protein